MTISIMQEFLTEGIGLVDDRVSLTTEALPYRKTGNGLKILSHVSIVFLGMLKTLLIRVG
jgi:hypothetical protein